MPENLFSNSLTVWGALAAGLLVIPPLIHLINRLRYRRVSWAAMEFLRISQRRNKNRIRLKQFLLLFSRMAILGLLLVLFSHLGCRNSQLAGLLGRGTTHHYVLLDDSLSMTAVEETGTSAFDRAKLTALKILDRAQNQPNQLVTIVRWTGTLAPEQTEIEESTPPTSRIDFNAVLIDSQTTQQIRVFLEDVQPSSLAVSPEPVAQLAEDLIRSRPSETAIAYWLSDFRNAEWQSPSSLVEQIKRTQTPTTRIELLRCDTASRENLAIRELRPVGNVRAVNVPIPVSLTIENFGEQAARNLTINLTQQAVSSPDGKQMIFGTSESLPKMFVDEIPAGEAIKRTFHATFQEPGSYVVRAELPPDSLLLDNEREVIFDIAPSRKVLVIEGPTPTPAAPFLELALGARDLTGLTVETRPLDFLRDPVDEALREFDVILVSGVGSLEESSVERLERFVSGGGGLAWFLGPETNREFYDQMLLRGGTGLFGVPLASAIEVAPRGSDDPPDMIVSDASILSVLGATRNSPLELVQVNRAFIPEPSWLGGRGTQADARRGAEIVCTLRGDSNRPLIVLDRFGQGRTALVLTTAAPVWNNWARNPTFVVAMMLLQDHLAGGRFPFANQIVGQPWNIPAVQGSGTLLLQTPATPREPGKSVVIEASVRDTSGAKAYSLAWDTGGQMLNQNPGIYATTTQTLGGNSLTEFYTAGVDCAESPLAVPSANRLVADLGGAAEVLAWDQFNPDPDNPYVTPLTRLLAILMGMLMLAESGLAFINSYHPRWSQEGVR
ncbi:MAG: BatA domain-containing protein [Pirellulaceae bacterium]|nr:BatA domain-containing protein [Pirellulaceae bacterium]